MWFGLAIVLIFGLWSCGDREGNAELEAYIARIQELHHHNRKIQELIESFDNPQFEAGEKEAEIVRKSIDDYAREVWSLGKLEDPALKKIHALYIRSFDETMDPDRDQSVEPGQEGNAAARRLRRLRRDLREVVYPALRVLMARRNLKGSEFALTWPR